MQTKRLENKDREEEAAQIALKEQAKKELEDWYKGHSEQVRVASELWPGNVHASVIGLSYVRILHLILFHH